MLVHYNPDRQIIKSDAIVRVFYSIMIVYHNKYPEMMELIIIMNSNSHIIKKIHLLV